MGDDLQKEIDRITSDAGSLPKVGAKRIKKSATRVAFEKFLEIDTDELKKQAKLNAKRKLLNIIGDILTEIVDMIFHGKLGHTAARNAVSSVIRSADKVSYKDYSAASKNGNIRASEGRYTFSDLKWARRVDATEVLDAFKNVLAEQGKLSVMNIYDMLDDPTNLEMKDNDWGWTDLSSAYVGMDGDVYRIYMPPVVALK